MGNKRYKQRVRTQKRKRGRLSQDPEIFKPVSKSNKLVPKVMFWILAASILLTIFSCGGSKTFTQYNREIAIIMTPEIEQDFDYIFPCSSRIDKGVSFYQLRNFMPNSMVMLQTGSTFRMLEVEGAGTIVRGYLAREAPGENPSPPMKIGRCVKGSDIWIDRAIDIYYLGQGCGAAVTVFDPRDPEFEPVPWFVYKGLGPIKKDNIKFKLPANY